jgi:hypothetical protein
VSISLVRLKILDSFLPMMISPFSLNKYFAEKCNELFIVGIDFKLEEYQADTWSHAFVIVS